MQDDPKTKPDPQQPRLETAEGGRAAGVASAGAGDTESYSPTGGSGERHWRAAAVEDGSLDRKDNVFFAAVEMTRMPMVLADPNRPDTPLVFCNNAFTDLTGYEPDEVIGRNCRFLQGAATDPAAVDELRAAVRERRATGVEILNYKKDGTPFWNAVFIGPVYDARGRLLYFFASQLDITPRRTSEAAFRQAQKMEAIGQLTAGLAHDFNNLLHVVAGNLEQASAKLDDDHPARRNLDHAAMAAERGARLTRQLLAFARKTRLDPKPVDLNAVVLEFGDMLDRTLGAAVDLRFDFQPGLPACLVDATQLESALLNTLLNARDAQGGRGELVVSTGLRRIEEDAPGRAPGDYVVLCVADSGEGMDEDVLRRATEPFFTTKGPGRGTGLGLAMVHGFVQQSRGLLEIDSAPGRGTTVRMLFPVGRAARAAPGPAQDPAAAAAPSRTILAVDDAEDVLALARENLETAGYRVIAARSGEEALEMFQADPQAVDLVFSDIVMPGGMSGMELREAVRRERPDLPVLLATGYNDELTAESPQAQGMDVLGKPYRRSELLDRVSLALNRARTRGEGG